MLTTLYVVLVVLTILFGIGVIGDENKSLKATYGAIVCLCVVIMTGLVVWNG